MQEVNWTPGDIPAGSPATMLPDPEGLIEKLGELPSDSSLDEAYTYNTSTAPAGIHRLGKLSQVSDGSGSTARDYDTDTGQLTSMPPHFRRQL